MKKTLLAGSAAWMLAFTVQAKAGILDFSPLHCETGFVNTDINTDIASPLTIGGFTFATTSVPFPGFETFCADATGYYPGTTALSPRTNSSQVVLTHGGDAFSLNSIGLAQLFTDTGWPDSGIPSPIRGPGFVTFFATTSSATEVSQSFQFGRNGGAPALEQLSFTSDFFDVVSVRWEQGQVNDDYWQFADVNAIAHAAASVSVPEPATLSLLGAGLLAMFVRRRRPAPKL